MPSPVGFRGGRAGTRACRGRPYGGLSGRPHYVGARPTQSLSRLCGGSRTPLNRLAALFGALFRALLRALFAALLVALFVALFAALLAALFAALFKQCQPRPRS